jgi:hypothetical protein
VLSNEVAAQYMYAHKVCFVTSNSVQSKGTTCKGHETTSEKSPAFLMVAPPHSLRGIPLVTRSGIFNRKTKMKGKRGKVVHVKSMKRPEKASAF